MKSPQWAMVLRHAESGRCGQCGRRGLATTYHCRPCADLMSKRNSARQSRKRAEAKREAKP